MDRSNLIRVSRVSRGSCVLRSLLISADRGSLGKEIFNVTIQIEETEGAIGYGERKRKRERERERERERDGLIKAGQNERQLSELVGRNGEV